MYIELKNINKVYGGFKASDDVSFGIEKGKLVALLGPSGSGKTTILRMIAGLEHQDSGSIYINGTCVDNLPVEKRDVGFVFQNYALFPYLTVYDNIAYGLKIKKYDKDKIKGRVTELLELVGLSGLEKRYPSQLSGGQRQRVAFARALAPNPQVLLLDEPFAAIDAKVRKELRTWLKKMILQIGITSIFVTHDQDEAVEVADEIIVTNKGRVEQTGEPLEIYKNPATPFVAQFIGDSAVISNYDNIRGFQRVEGMDNAIIRPEFVCVKKEKTGEVYENSYCTGIVKEVSFMGNCLKVDIDVNGLILIANMSFDSGPVKTGDEVNVLVYRMYLFNNEKTLLLENENLKENYMFYI